MGHSSLLLFMAAKPRIPFPSQTGTSFIGIARCSITQFRTLMFQLIQFIAIVMHM